ncbi:MAG: hypothetical protein OES26_19645 [Gammaproteobacteria bacterium]|nr:hypothetical protein [Gammaproteobacteria bacterium]
MTHNKRLEFASFAGRTSKTLRVFEASQPKRYMTKTKPDIAHADF